jgi:hypothetical protein
MTAQAKRYHEGARRETIALRPDFDYNPCAEGHSTDTYVVDLATGGKRTECRRCGKPTERGDLDDDYFWI